MCEQTPPAKKEFAYYAPYAEFSKTLRTWFVAYGIGGPVVLLSSDTAWARLVEARCSPIVGLLFLIGVFFQIIAALLNKHAMWHLYFEEEDSRLQNSDKKYKHAFVYRLSYWYSDQNWMDVFFDLYTLVFFGWATYLAFKVLSNPAGAIYCKENFWSERACLWVVMVLLFAGWFCFTIRSFKSAGNPRA